MFKLIFPIAFVHQPIYHTAISTDLPFQSDIKPSFDGYAFHKLRLFLQGGNDMDFSIAYLNWPNLTLPQLLSYNP